MTGAERRAVYVRIAEHAVRVKEFSPGVWWVLLNLPRQSATTLYMGASRAEADLVAAAARKSAMHAMEFMAECASNAMAIATGASPKVPDPLPPDPLSLEVTIPRIQLVPERKFDA
jgi:hypothetical protein